MSAENHVQKAFPTVIYMFKIAPAYVENACGYSVYDSNGKWMEGVYTRVHRDVEIINAMRNWMGLRSVKDAKELGLSQNCVSPRNNEFLTYLS